MATLIAVYTSNGCVGRCDAKCYNALKPKCDCVCGGVNHGVGLKKATEQTKVMAEKTIEKINKKKTDECLRIFKQQKQLEMFL
jgi:hypothetical protein